MLHSILGLTGKEYTRIVPALFSYFFHRIDMEEFIEFVGDRKEGTRIKDLARVNGYVLKNCKLYAYACYTARHAGQTLPNAKAYGVSNKDVAILSRLNLSHLDKRFRSFTLKEFDATVNAMIISPEIKNNIGKFVTKKMTFLMNSYGQSRHDIEAFLKESAILAVYKQYPRYESYLHFINVAKAQIHNKGQTHITSSTSASRQKLMKDANGVQQAVHVPIETIGELAAPLAYGQEVRERIKALAQIEHKLPDRTKEFLLCASGQYHAGFSAYLNCNNDDAADTISYEKYMNRLHQYFNVTVASTERLYRNMRTMIHRCNHDDRGTDNA